MITDYVIDWDQTTNLLQPKSLLSSKLYTHGIAMKGVWLKYN